MNGLPARPNPITGVRNSMVPNEAAALWSIEHRNTAIEAGHAQFHTHRRDSSPSFSRLWQMVFGGGD